MQESSALRVIVGPTGAGKSAMALALAQRHRGAIISADSRQVYRGFDIGTAKPTLEERELVQHHGVDVADPTERYSAARWAEGARGWVASARSAGRTPMVVGGTGFYVRALVEPLTPAPWLDPGRRRRLEELVDRWPLEKLRRWVRELDPDRAHLGPAQLRRALETALLTGHRLSDIHRAERPTPRLPARYLLVDPGVHRLLRRIEQRVDAMFAAGWADEVRELMRSVPDDAPAWNASGHDAVRRMVLGELTTAAAREAVIVATRQYAKRQRTWLRHQLAGQDVTLVDPEAADAGLVAERWWLDAAGCGEEAANQQRIVEHTP